MLVTFCSKSWYFTSRVQTARNSLRILLQTLGQENWNQIHVKQLKCISFEINLEVGMQLSYESFWSRTIWNCTSSKILHQKHEKRKKEEGGGISICPSVINWNQQMNFIIIYFSINSIVIINGITGTNKIVMSWDYLIFILLQMSHFYIPWVVPFQRTKNFSFYPWISPV